MGNAPSSSADDMPLPAQRIVRIDEQGRVREEATPAREGTFAVTGPLNAGEERAQAYRPPFVILETGLDRNSEGLFRVWTRIGRQRGAASGKDGK